MQVAQPRAGLDGQVGDQERAQIAVGAQRVSLAARTVQGEHPLQPEPFAERVGRGERLELGDKVPVPAAVKQRFGSRFERGQALLLKSARLRPGERRGVQVGQRRPAPQLQGLVEPLRRGGGVAARQRRVPLRGELLESPRVQFGPGVTRSR